MGITFRNTGFNIQMKANNGGMHLLKIMRTPDFWVVVDDPEEYLNADVVANTALSHPTMKTEIGLPAVIASGDAYPTVAVRSNVYGSMGGTLFRNRTEEVLITDAILLIAGAG
ncbi:hypothetical protein M3650_13295 [Paenibacillus sp. MER TA 81-3]|nr:hypothetical protein [Paenibacillus sp. MER TA 81-3]